MNRDPTADDIRARMAAVREHLDHDVEGIVEGAGRLTDWRNYVQAFPWGSMAAAAALGYLAVPRRLEIVSPDAETLEKLARKNRLVVEHRPRGRNKRGVLATGFNLVGNMLLRAAIAYAGQQVGKVLGPEAAEVSQQGAASP